MKKYLLAASAVIIFTLLTQLSTKAQVITFDDLSFASGDFENGANLTGSSSTTNDPFGPGGSLITTNSTFQSGGGGTTGNFSNTYNAFYDGPNGTGTFQYDYWSGWSYSRTTDTVTSGFGNQYSAITGGGASGSSVYGVSFGSSSLSFTTAQDFTGRGIEVTNTTYAFNEMRDGNVGSFPRDCNL